MGGVLVLDLCPVPSLRKTLRTLPSPPLPARDDEPLDLAFLLPFVLLESSAADEDGRWHTSQDWGGLRALSLPSVAAAAPSTGEKPFEHAHVMPSSCEATSVRQVLIARILREILSLLAPGQASGAGTGAGGSGATTVGEVMIGAVTRKSQGLRARSGCDERRMVWSAQPSSAQMRDGYQDQMPAKNPGS